MEGNCRSLGCARDDKGGMVFYICVGYWDGTELPVHPLRFHELKGVG
jgi:hypothetical protein